MTAQHKARPSGALKGSLEIQTCKRRKNKSYPPAPENTWISTLPIQARATTGVGKPQADSEERANSAGRFRHGCTRKLLSSGKFAGRCGRSPYLFQGRLQCTYNHPKNEQIASRNQGWFRFVHKIMWFLRGKHHFVSRNFPVFFSASARNAPSCRFCKFLSKVRGRLANPNAIW